LLDYEGEYQIQPIPIVASKVVKAIVLEGRYYNKKERARVFKCHETSNLNGITRYCTSVKINASKASIDFEKAKLERVKPRKAKI